ncbi:MAG: glycosyltransferase, partial [Parvularculaceae bacterium]|nr:glycosyltransferase [Parvularculaceae bacterium]
MKFSIITPTLNAALYLRDLTSCLSAQTYQDWEHIIVDGGSTDDTLSLAEAWISSEPRARLLQLGELGLYPSIMSGLSEASGDVLSWLNADDLYTPWALSTVCEHIERTGATWVTGLPGMWDRESRLRLVRPYGHYPQDWIRRGCFHIEFLGYLQQESMFFSRQLFYGLKTEQRKEIEEKKLAGDFLLWRRFAETAPLSVIPSVIGGFRLHTSNLSVEHASAYIDEVRASGAPFPPKPL